jgi:hypothetical protein
VQQAKEAPKTNQHSAIKYFCERTPYEKIVIVGSSTGDPHRHNRFSTTACLQVLHCGDLIRADRATAQIVVAPFVPGFGLDADNAEA